MVALNLQGMWEVLFRVCHDVVGLHQGYDISLTVSFGTGNIFLNLVKDLNKGEVVSQHRAILQVSSGNTLHLLEVNQ